jgi:glyoxylase-like metal-dependent hydrolase (beta-lactamase superfamily II)/rhodanese-related sulfurtransferase
MLFRQLYDADSSTYTYLLADEQTREAVIIDPVIEQFDRDRTLIEELELKLLYVLDTHVHADHITGSGLLRERLGAKTIVSERAGVVCADRLVKQGDIVAFGRHKLEVRETPGHTSGCLTFVCAEEKLAFTGDALLIRSCGRTDFQQGDSATLFRSVHGQILSLPEDTALYPAHDYKGRTSTTVREELKHNPRLGQSKSLAEFIDIMAALKLPYPKKIDASLPANVQCGVVSAQPSVPVQLDRSWADVAQTTVGVPEVSVDWLSAHRRDDLQLLDVREPDEYRGVLGHVAGASLVPLGMLRAAARSLDHNRPIVLICRSGGRSGRAAMELLELGFARVASLRGGMIAWNESGLPIDRSPPEQQVLSRQG